MRIHVRGKKKERVKSRLDDERNGRKLRQCWEVDWMEEPTLQ